MDIALLILSSITVFGLFIVASMVLVLMDRTKQLSNLPGQLEALNKQYQQFDNAPPPVFRSMDGRYEAASLDELIQKMQADPTSGLTEADADELRNMFNGLTQNMDDDDDDLEDWQKKGRG